MKIIILIFLFIITGCSAPVKCVDGVIYQNVDPLGIGDIYTPTNSQCINFEEKKS